MKRLMKRLMRLISRAIRNKYWNLLVAGLVLFIAGVAAGRQFHSIKIDLFCSCLFIAGIVLISVAVSRTGGEAERPAAKVEKPEVKPAAKKDRDVKRKKKAAPDTASWDI